MGAMRRCMHGPNIKHVPKDLLLMIKLMVFEGGPSMEGLLVSTQFVGTARDSLIKIKYAFSQLSLSFRWDLYTSGVQNWYLRLYTRSHFTFNRRFVVQSVLLPLFHRSSDSPYDGQEWQRVAFDLYLVIQKSHFLKKEIDLFKILCIC